ncbi:hypothetical protein PC129_g21060 [Phytophthora cactorum]|uniref:Uncharacterized protein n=1 Tax=Phytophthora cactorum TaxID=29920 RepID=A0A8T0XVY5_9STRA|nr:hypothetical protein Pcac1_g27532 [Phytophthora cactorum]KAG2792549.1 hypothetical protein PC111_g23415 [Phytophthora cactorum]KAG2793322.1 hypothetical protein PC112_g23493 [Phytophthora cactorum]KAG2815236.1 hypothetical protein PC113_g23229 [Phytophthora cactorum]KAG2872744.1 hypothetical protein PC114_g26220 [Phytophthora cactorum]
MTTEDTVDVEKMSVPLMEVFERMPGVGINKLAVLSLDQNGMKLASLLGVGSNSSFERFTFLCESPLQCVDNGISLSDLSSRQFQVLRVKTCRFFHLLEKCVDANVSSSQTPVLGLE